MLKRVITLLICVALFAGLAIPAFASPDPYSVYVDDVLISDSCEAYNGTVYVPLIAVVQVLRPDATATWEKDYTLVEGSDFSIAANPDEYFFVVNERYLFAPNKIKVDGNGAVLVPMPLLAWAMGASSVTEGYTVKLQSGGVPCESGNTYYDAQTVDMLSRAIAHESGNQPLFGQIGVGNVMLNRVNSPVFPNTLIEVIEQPGQFPGVLNAEPTQSTIIAAKLCLDGASSVGDAYWFSTVGLSCWASQKKQLVTVIGGQAFYG